MEHPEMFTNNSSGNTDDTILASLINPHSIRNSIKRLFKNSICETLSELLQNSQRARAKNVWITTGDESFTYCDDGHGLLNGIAGFHTLLRLADSHFENDTVEDQHPMGLGIHALLALEQVSQVTFQSGEYQLAIDCAQWWENKEYYEAWFHRLERLETAMSGGLMITVRCTEALATAVQGALDPQKYGSNSNSPAQGYKETLAIFLNNQVVDTSLPSWAIPQPVVTTEYQNCPLIIGLPQNDYH